MVKKLRLPKMICKKMRLPKLQGGVTTADRNRWKKELGKSWKLGQGGKRPYITNK